MASEQQSSDFSEVKKEMEDFIKQTLLNNLRVVVSKEKCYHSFANDSYTKVKIFWGRELISEDYA